MFQTCDPRGGASFDPKGHHMNNLCRGPLGDATYQISQLSLLVSEKKIFKDFGIFFLLVAMATRLMAGFNLLNNFGRASPKKHPCQVSSRFAQWFRRRYRYTY